MSWEFLSCYWHYCGNLHGLATVSFIYWRVNMFMGKVFLRGRKFGNNVVRYFTNFLFSPCMLYIPPHRIILHPITQIIPSGLQAVQQTVSSDMWKWGLRYALYINFCWTTYHFLKKYCCLKVRGSSVGIATRYELDGAEIESPYEEIFHTRPDSPWGPPSLLFNGYRVFLGSKTMGAWRWPPAPPSSEVAEIVLSALGLRDRF
jgi:hypothetical protein